MLVDDVEKATLAYRCRSSLRHVIRLQLLLIQQSTVEQYTASVTVIIASPGNAAVTITITITVTITITGLQLRVGRSEHWSIQKVP